MCVQGFRRSNKNHPLKTRLSWVVKRLEEHDAAFGELAPADRERIAVEARRRFLPQKPTHPVEPDSAVRNVRHWLQFCPRVGASALEVRELLLLTDLADCACHNEKDVRRILRELPPGARLDPLLRVAWAATAFPGDVRTSMRRDTFATRRNRFLELLAADPENTAPRERLLVDYLHRDDLLDQPLDRRLLSDDEIAFMHRVRTERGRLAGADAEEESVQDPSTQGWCPPRPQQRVFREALLKSFGGRCLVTGTTALAALDAAHVRPYALTRRCDPENGLLLRADIHRLFDAGDLLLIPRGEILVVRVHKELGDVGYRELDGREVVMPGGLGATAVRWLAASGSPRAG